jgi:hypothetical protein
MMSVHGMGSSLPGSISKRIGVMPAKMITTE